VVFDILDSAGAFVLLVVLLVVALITRGALLRRNGASLPCALRFCSSRTGYGWQLGTLRYSPRHLQWFRIFSVSPGAKVTLVRRRIDVVGRRAPRGFELHSIPHGAVVVHCATFTADGEPLDIELAMGERALTGFLAWLESAPPGAHQNTDARRA
jgi:hypothetical protein